MEQAETVEALHFRNRYGITVQGNYILGPEAIRCAEISPDATVQVATNQVAPTQGITPIGSTLTLETGANHTLKINTAINGHSECQLSGADTLDISAPEGVENLPQGAYAILQSDTNLPAKFIRTTCNGSLRPSHLRVNYLHDQKVVTLQVLPKATMILLQ